MKGPPVLDMPTFVLSAVFCVCVMLSFPQTDLIVSCAVEFLKIRH